MKGRELRTESAGEQVPPRGCWTAGQRGLRSRVQGTALKALGCNLQLQALSCQLSESDCCLARQQLRLSRLSRQCQALGALLGVELIARGALQRIAKHSPAELILADVALAHLDAVTERALISVPAPAVASQEDAGRAAAAVWARSTPRHGLAAAAAGTSTRNVAMGKLAGRALTAVALREELAGPVLLHSPGPRLPAMGPKLALQVALDSNFMLQLGVSV